MSLLFFFVLMTGGGCVAPERRSQQDSDYYARWAEILTPFVYWAPTGEVDTLLSVPVAVAAKGKSALDVARTGLAHLMAPASADRDRHIRRAAAIIDYLFESFPYRSPDDDGYPFWYYPEPTNLIPAGWWSAMDNAEIAVLTYSAFQLTGLRRYRDLAFDTLRAMLRSPQQRGSLLRLPDGGCWLTGWTWGDITPTSALYVLNSNLFALLALEFITTAEQDTQFQAELECLNEGLRNMLPRFRFPDDRWTYYMLNPRKKASPTHYILFELSLLDGLSGLTGKPELQSEALLRRKILAREYPFVWSRNTSEVVFSAVGGPQPFLQDIFVPILHCLVDARRNQFVDYGLPQGRGTFLERGLLRFSTRRSPAACQLWVTQEGAKGLPRPIFVYPEMAPSGLTSPLEEVPYTLERILFDAVPGPDGTVDLVPRRQARPEDPDHYYNFQGRAYLKPEREIFLADYSGLVLELERAVPVQGNLYVGFDLFGEDGKSWYQDYRILCPRESYLLLLSTFGGTGSEPVTKLTSLSIIFRTGHAEKAGIDLQRVSFGRLFAVRNWVDLMSRVQRTGAELAYLDDPVDACPDGSL